MVGRSETAQGAKGVRGERRVDEEPEYKVKTPPMRVASVARFVIKYLYFVFETSLATFLFEFSQTRPISLAVLALKIKGYLTEAE